MSWNMLKEFIETNEMQSAAGSECLKNYSTIQNFEKTSEPVMWNI